MSPNSVEEWENTKLSSPLANQVSSEHDQHQPEDPEFVPNPNSGKCRCDRCVIIRIKKRRALRFPRTKCPQCGELFVKVFEPLCEKCR